jgi:hypothetical protein
MDQGVSFRPTPAQALGRGLYLGGLAGLVVGVLTAGLAVAGLSTSLGRPAWLLGLIATTGLSVVGALVGLAFGRGEGTDVDDAGIHPLSGTSAAWQHIDDLCTERTGGRVRVTVQLDSGRVARLHAPYDGRWLAGDPEFERKLFMLRNRWETHRNFTVRRPYPVDGACPG